MLSFFKNTFSDKPDITYPKTKYAKELGAIIGGTYNQYGIQSLYYEDRKYKTYNRKLVKSTIDLIATRHKFCDRIERALFNQADYLNVQLYAFYTCSLKNLDEPKSGRSMTFHIDKNKLIQTPLRKFKYICLKAFLWACSWMVWLIPLYPLYPLYPLTPL